MTDRMTNLVAKAVRSALGATAKRSALVGSAGSGGSAGSARSALVGSALAG